MEHVVIVIVLALIEYIGFGIMVGVARGKYNCPAPAITGDPIFERYYRVQQNTLEQLVIFLPAITIYGYYGNPAIAAGVGLVFVVSRLIYMQAYVSDPAKRGRGFVPGFFANAFLLVAGLIAVINQLL
jgi:uncharacterized MAPEG superfamily protein